jgi:hypothetical protein
MNRGLAARMFCGNGRRTSVSPNGDLGCGGAGAGNRDDVTVVRTTVVVVVVVVVVGVGRGHGEYGGGGGVWFGELEKRCIRLCMPIDIIAPCHTLSQTLCPEHMLRACLMYHPL